MGRLQELLGKEGRGHTVTETLRRYLYRKPLGYISSNAALISSASGIYTHDYLLAGAGFVAGTYLLYVTIEDKSKNRRELHILD